MTNLYEFSSEQNLISSSLITHLLYFSALLWRSFDMLASNLHLVQLWLIEYLSNEVEGKEISVNRAELTPSLNFPICRTRITLNRSRITVLYHEGQMRRCVGNLEGLFNGQALVFASHVIFFCLQEIMKW